MKTVAAILAWQAFLVQGRPQSAKIIFSTDDVQPLGHGDCDHDQGMLYWLEDGQCYNIGDRGPCNFGEVIWFLKKPVCIPENEVPSTKTTHKMCNDDGLIFWPETGLCYSLLTQGPCPEGHWLQLASSTTAMATCAPQPCQDAEAEVFWPEICKCISANSTEDGRYGPADVCGPGSELVWTPYGEGVCTCSENFYTDEVGNCFEIGSVGPCENGDIWGVVNGSTACVKNYNEIRVFDLIPANHPNSLPKSRTTQVQRCHVDEKGRCRKTLNLRNRFGDSENFSSWLAGFERRSSEQCQVATCSGDKLPWLDGKCYQLASTGPCEEGSWLVLDSVKDGQPIMKCKNKKCNDGIWWPKTCSCIKQPTTYTAHNLDFANIPNFVSPCEENEQVLLNPYGEGICGCIDNHVRDTNGKCYEVGKQGPCEDYEVFSVEDGVTSCIDQGNVTNRIFDLIPTNVDPSSRSALDAARATRQTCHVDENGKCRKILNLRGRIDIGNTDGEEMPNNIQDLINWFETFEKQLDTCESPITCKDETFLWEDGNCYPLATTGPCGEGKWFVLDSIVDGVPVIKCKAQKCPGGIWWSETCSCFRISSLKIEDAVAVPTGPCKPNEDILINPYGEGVCACKDMFIRHTDGECYKVGSDGPCAENKTYIWDGSQGICEGGDVQKRIFDVIPANNPAERSVANIGRATRQNCNADELGKCRKTLNLRNRIDDAVENDKTNDTTDIVEWLVQFANNEGKCDEKAKTDDRNKVECHRQGKVLFEDGECYNLLERGPCFESAMWLVMSVENGILVPRCKHRQCLSSSGAFVASDCQCYQRKVADVCGKNEQLYDNIFGQGICGCSPGHAVWDGDESCHPIHQQGPCEEGEVLVLSSDGRTECVRSSCSDGLVEIETDGESNCYESGNQEPCKPDHEVGINYTTLKAECIQSDERNRRVFDLIPASQNQANSHGSGMSKVTKETCVLDNKGRCRRKLNLKRGTNKNEAQLFEEWIQSFKVISPTKYKC
eukprot:GFUD01008690.1.p1 GENE.GFUD01008690.1~~GFUD01008690.1.p1  ORF type:complete len:1006 (-),score=224.49 GFUD01008690.1:142-3159(-)